MSRRSRIVRWTAAGVAAAAAVAVGIVVAVNSDDSEPPRGGPGSSAASSAAASSSAGGGSTATALPAHPDASTTGIPAGTRLRSAEGMTVDDDGTVVDGLDIKGCLTIDADNVTVRNSRISCTSETGSVVKVAAGHTGVLLENVEIDGLGATATCVASGGYTLRRANVHNCADGARANSNTLVELSWIHDLARQPGSHDDAIQTNTGSNIVIRYNYLQPYRNDTHDTMNAAYLFGGEGVSNIRVYGNLLDGGNITLQGIGADVQVTDNVFTTRHKYGPLRLRGEYKVSGNRYTDGTPVNNSN